MRLVLGLEMKWLLCTISRKGRERGSQGYPRRCCSFWELTQSEVLFATVSQDIDELGLVCSPFQFPCLVQVLRRKKRGRYNRKNKPRETGQVQNNCLILDRAATGDLLTFLPIFLSVEAPTPPSPPNQTSPTFFQKYPCGLSDGSFLLSLSKVPIVSSFCVCVGVCEGVSEGQPWVLFLRNGPPCLFVF